MLHIPDNVRQDIIRLVPSYIINEISCFVYYDNHPRDTKSIDITVCTKTGEVKEFYQREIVSEVYLECSTPSEIKIMRNSDCTLFYLVVTSDNLLILSRTDKLSVHRKVDNVERYDIEDSLCHGDACLKIVRKDDAVPLIFDDNFESLGDKAILLSSMHTVETYPVLTELNRKLTEAKYSVKCNESMYREYQNLRQLAAFSMYRKIHPNLNEAVFRSGTKEMAGALKIKTHSPWVKLCNKKVVIVLNVINENKECLEDVHILLHVKNRPSLVYTTRLFQKLPMSPYWKEKHSHSIEHTEVAVTAIVDLVEMKENILSRVDFNVVMVYRRNAKEYLLPFNSVSLSAKDVMGEDFDVLSSGCLDEQHAILAILATTEKTDLILRHIRDVNEIIDIPALLATQLQMQQLQDASNVFIHRSSPYHPLNGVLIVFSDAKGPLRSYDMTIHSRSPSQVLSFIHYVHDAIPQKIIITTVNYKIVAKTNEYSQYTEELSTSPSNVDYTDYATAMLNQSTMLKEHLDACMVSMNNSGVPEVQRKIGTEIDLYAAGTPAYAEVRNKMLSEESRGIRLLSSSSGLLKSESIVID